MVSIHKVPVIVHLIIRVISSTFRFKVDTMLDTNVVSTPNVLKLNGYPIILLLQSEMVVGVFLSTTFNIHAQWT